MDSFTSGPALRGVVCGCLKELHQSILLGIQTPDIIERFLMLLLFAVIAVKIIYKWQLRDQCLQILVAWFSRSSNGQLASLLGKSIWTLRWNLILVGCALVHRGFEVLLKALVSGFPFQPDTVNEWFTVDVPCEARANNSEEEGRPHLNVMNVNKTGWESKIYNIQNNAAFPDNLLEENHKVFFHGTSHEWAKDIINKGIDLSKSRNDLDFGTGFYLNDKLDEALTWARNKYSTNPAVLVYRFKTAELDKYKKLDRTITEDVKTKRAWEEVIGQFRNGKPDKSFYKNVVKKVDYIEGPIAKDRKVDYPHPIPESYQLCVRSEKMADDSDGCLNSVLFILGKIKKR